MSDTMTRFFRVRTDEGRTHIINLAHIVHLEAEGDGESLRVEVVLSTGKEWTAVGKNAGRFLIFVESYCNKDAAG